ncbi:MAG TPA: EAL domain-containing protein [Candidatus Limnocylindrales bacterium]|nr:EAL domain-containing protein [Candidatus Limnocylindrales bacterium]
MRFLTGSRTADDERLLWARDIRFVNRVARTVAVGRILELEAGSCLIAPAASLTDAVVADVARAARNPEYGVVAVDRGLPEHERYLVAFSAAVQVSGIADRIGMAQSTHVAQTKTLDYFFSLKNVHDVHFQPIVELATGDLHEYECLFRPVMPMLPQSITAIVHAGIDTDRSVELDAFIVARILGRLAELKAAGEAVDSRYAINVTPASLLASAFDPAILVAMVRDAGLAVRQLTVECTEQQAVADPERLVRRVKELRRLGFGFAVDDAGAGYASFTLIAALRPSIIKIDREIVHGIGSKKGDAKQALVEAFVSFGRRIGAQLVAEGIENRRDLAMLTALGVEYGQGYLLGRPSSIPKPARHPTAEVRSSNRAHRAHGRSASVEATAS